MGHFFVLKGGERKEVNGKQLILLYKTIILLSNRESIKYPRVILIGWIIVTFKRFINYEPLILRIDFVHVRNLTRS